LAAKRVKSRKTFCRSLATLELTQAELAVALLWFYRQAQQYEERAATELADDLREEGFPRPNSSRLHDDLRRSKFTIKGRRKGTFQLDVRRVPSLDERYQKVLGVTEVEVDGAIVPSEWVAGRFYLERLCRQINGAYEYGFYDASAVLCRRLMESLIVETYIAAGLQHEIKPAGAFLMLDGLIAHIRSHKTIVLGRSSPKTMQAVKELGDTAAHDRTYVTQQKDVDDLKLAYRKLIQELLTLGGVIK
jgi:hypothetical protein